ncbi:hypothetical protein BJV74DRAFT_852951 [Russula compacta]|nr:hypothetical protein BJV74DRAFT_852951 [Russula compacta]
MPPTKGPLWKFFYTTGEKQNKSHYKAYCLGCVSHHASAEIPLNANGVTGRLARGQENR